MFDTTTLPREAQAYIAQLEEARDAAQQYTILVMDERDAARTQVTQLRSEIYVLTEQNVQLQGEAETLGTENFNLRHDLGEAQEEIRYLQLGRMASRVWDAETQRSIQAAPLTDLPAGNSPRFGDGTRFAPVQFSAQEPAYMQDMPELRLTPSAAEHDSTSGGYWAGRIQAERAPQFRTHAPIR